MLCNIPGTFISLVSLIYISCTYKSLVALLLNVNNQIDLCIVIHVLNCLNNYYPLSP